MWEAIYHEFRRWAKASRRAVTAYNRAEITVETEQIWIIRKSRTTRGWRAECGREVDMVGLKEAEALREMAQPSTTQPMLPGCGDSRGWHWSLDSAGSPRVCLASALQSRQSGAIAPLCLPADQTSLPAPELGARQLEVPKTSQGEKQ